MTGTVKWFDFEKGYGFITDSEGRDFFVHYSSIIDDDVFKILIDGEIVEFEIGNGTNGREQAVNVKVIDSKREDCFNNDPRLQIVNQIEDEFGIVIPLLSWSGMELMELVECYAEFKVEQALNEKE